MRHSNITNMKELEILKTENGDYQTTLTASYKAKGVWKALDPKQILSFIPGTITSIDVKAGQQVKVGDRMLMFNAMKMENTMVAPFNGTIAEVHVSVGQAVPKGVVLVSFV